jgi:hypothetical protein
MQEESADILNEDQLVEFYKRHPRFPKLPLRYFKMLLRHEDVSENDFWNLRNREDEDAKRYLIERDSNERIIRCLRASLNVDDFNTVGDQSIKSYYGFEYEEWEHNKDGTAVMKREASNKTELTRRDYKDGVMTEEITAITYADRTQAIELIRPVIKPLSDPNQDVYYAVANYKIARTEGNQENLEECKFVYPSPRVLIGTQNMELTAVNLEDENVNVIFGQHRIAVFDLTENLTALRVQMSENVYRNEVHSPASASTQENNILVYSEYGQVTFPAQLNLKEVLASLAQ